MKELREAIRNAAKGNDEIYSLVGIVKAVDEGKRTCDVEPSNGGAMLFDVRLQAKESGTEGVVFVPKKDSEVIVTFMSRESAFVSMFSDLESITLVKSDLNVATETTELFDIIDSLIDVLKVFKLSTNVGVTIQVLPDIQAKLEVLKNRNSSVKKKFSKLLKS